MKVNVVSDWVIDRGMPETRDSDDKIKCTICGEWSNPDCDDAFLSRNWYCDDCEDEDERLEQESLIKLKAAKAKARAAAVEAGCVECGTKDVTIYRHTGAYCENCHTRAIDNNDIDPCGAEVI